MSWQRIDENTYIDDTLVTCAEYQLFIDEMREQGKYYQPDHWTTNQFPEGQAKEPILGVRHSDAETLCEWITKRDNTEWNFRLPTQHEVTQFPMEASRESSFGYYLYEKFLFIWASPVPQNARGMEQFANLASEGISEQKLSLLYNDVRSSPLHISPIIVDLANTLNGVIDSMEPLVPTVLYDAASKVGGIIQDIEYFRAVNKTIDHDLAHTRDIFKFITSARRGSLTQVRDLTLKMYIELFTLHERIAGRSPAFEGIRLVKERIK